MYRPLDQRFPRAMPGHETNVFALTSTVVPAVDVLISYNFVDFSCSSAKEAAKQHRPESEIWLTRAMPHPSIPCTTT